jgi:hypothetical protein
MGEENRLTSRATAIVQGFATSAARSATSMLGVSTIVDHWAMNPEGFHKLAST